MLFSGYQTMTIPANRVDTGIPELNKLLGRDQLNKVKRPDFG